MTGTAKQELAAKRERDADERRKDAIRLSLKEELLTLEHLSEQLVICEEASAAFKRASRLLAQLGCTFYSRVETLDVSPIIEAARHRTAEAIRLVKGVCE